MDYNMCELIFVYLDNNDKLKFVKSKLNNDFGVDYLARSIDYFEQVANMPYYVADKSVDKMYFYEFFRTQDNIPDFRVCDSCQKIHYYYYGMYDKELIDESAEFKYLHCKRHIICKTEACISQYNAEKCDNYDGCHNLVYICKKKSEKCGHNKCDPCDAAMYFCNQKCANYFDPCSKCRLKLKN
jgi:hypothetical protein